MNMKEQLIQQLIELQLLVRIQRGVRLGLRALWLGLLGVILGWSLSKILPGVLPPQGEAPAWLGWLSRPEAWFLTGLVFASLPVMAYLLSLTSPHQWVWLVDQRLGLREQISTAWEIAHTHPAAQKERPTGEVSETLIREVLAFLPRLQARVLRRGWFLKRDLISLLIAVALGGLLIASELIDPYSVLLREGGPQSPELSFEQFPADPALAQPAEPEGSSSPEAGNVPPPTGGEAPGDGAQEGEGQPSEEGTAGDQSGENPAQGNSAGSGNPAERAEALRELGSDLSGQAGTYDLGQALEQLDLGEAAEALEDLSVGVDELSPESRENLAEALQEAAEALEQAGDQGLADDMREAAEALQDQDLASPGSPGSEAAGEALDQVAGDLRDLAGGQTAGANPGDGTGGGSGVAEPLNRLPGEGGSLELPLEDSSEPGLLSPAPPEAAGGGTAGGSLDGASLPGEAVIQSPLLPNSFLWKWRDVVSEYFHR